MLKRFILSMIIGILIPLSAIAGDRNCQYEGKTCIYYHEGFCTEYKLNYNCSVTNQTCASYSTTTSGDCTSNTAGTQNQTAQSPNNNNFNEAMKDLALLNAIKKNLSGINPIRIFGGKYYNCVNQLASGIGLTEDCCKLNLKPTDHGLFAGCSKEAVKLAGYVRAGTAHEFASGCNGGFSFFGACVVCAGNQQDYCAFDNKLSKIIQIKGREQLAQLAAAGYAGAKSGSQQTFTYYDGGSTNNTGKWFTFPNLNNNQVWIWQWPGACNSENASSSLKCPYRPKLYVMYCNKSDCVTPTTSPMSATPTGDDLVSVNPEKNQSTAISKYVVLTGACTSAQGSNEANNCGYTESAYPGTGGGAAGDAVLRATLTFPLYVYTVSSSNDGYITSSEAANAEFWGQSRPMSEQSSTLPSTVNIKYTVGNEVLSSSTAASPNNAEYTITLPTHILMTSNFSISGNSEGKIHVFGGCHSNSNLCSYTFEIPADAHAKPWYTNTHGGPCNHMPVQSTINCSGFTLKQFEELNLAKMHLGKILLDMAPKEPSESSEQSTASSEASSQANNPDSPVGSGQN